MILLAGNDVCVHSETTRMEPQVCLNGYIDLTNTFNKNLNLLKILFSLDKLLFMIEKKLIEEENKKIRRLQLMINLTLQILYETDDLTLDTGLKHIKSAKKFALYLFPGKELAFDLIYKPRLLRALTERGLLTINSN